MAHTEEDDRGYLKKVSDFYFGPVIRSFFSAMYLFFFIYVTIFYANNIILAIQFVFYTILTSTPLLSLSYLFWGALFLLFLLVPVALSLYAIFLPYEIACRGHWTNTRKSLLIALVLLSTLDCIILSDYAIRYIATQDPVVPFAQTHHLTTPSQQ
ncbi:MAG: hypothetical protein RLZZ347_248 [Candidatus Parcubacteria bacterium]|jgi:hypothetical protein